MLPDSQSDSLGKGRHALAASGKIPVFLDVGPTCSAGSRPSAFVRLSLDALLFRAGRRAAARRQQAQYALNRVRIMGFLWQLFFS
jgi:hypothetical protein